MIKLEDKPNVIAPGGDYPYGDIKDNSGAGDGTPVSRTVYADIHQFFSRLMAIAGVVANGLPDNAANSFQLFEALDTLIQSYISGLEYYVDSLFNSLNPVWQAIPLNSSGGASYAAGSRTPEYAVLGNGQVLLRGIITSGGAPPVGDHAVSSAPIAVPDQRRDFLVLRSALTDVTTFYIHTDGTLRADAAVYTWGGTAVLDGLNYWM